MLRRLRTEGDFNGGYAMVFWGLAGCGLGVGAGALFHGSPAVAGTLLIIGGLVGVCIGLFAALGASMAARILVLPGILIEIIVSIFS
jgi:hypothetical protein